MYTAVLLLLIICLATPCILRVLNKFLSRCECHPTVGDSSVGGKGVFASKCYKAGTQIDQCTTVSIPYSSIVGKGLLENYVFQTSGYDKKEVLVPLGNCGLYNHSDTNNASYIVNPNGTIDVFANRNIAVGDEIFVNYGDRYWESRGLSPV